MGEIHSFLPTGGQSMPHDEIRPWPFEVRSYVRAASCSQAGAGKQQHVRCLGVCRNPGLNQEGRNVQFLASNKAERVDLFVRPQVLLDTSTCTRHCITAKAMMESCWVYQSVADIHCKYVL